MSDKIVTAKSKPSKPKGGKHKIHMRIHHADNGLVVTTHREEPEPKTSRNAARSGVMRTGMDEKPTETVHKSMASLHKHIDENYGGLIPATEPDQAALAAGGDGQQPGGDREEQAASEADAG